LTGVEKLGIFRKNQILSGIERSKCMARTLWIAALIAAGMLFTGCENPRVSDAHLLTTEASMEAAAGEGFLVPDAAEADYVENAAAARQAYRDALTSLAEYYGSVGNATKLRWANTELKTFDQMVHYRYLQPAEWVPPSLKAMDSLKTPTFSIGRPENWKATPG